MQIEHKYKNVKGLLEWVLYSAAFRLKTIYVKIMYVTCLVI